ncbi:MAG: nuclease-related domain-containing protein [Steroidobacteraceae bacterium]
MSPVLVAIVAALSGIFIGIGLAWGWRRYRLRALREALVARITSVALDHARDVLIDDGNGEALHLDYVMLTPRGVLVIDVRDVAGNVFGSDQMSDWTVMDGSQRFTFQNPQGGLYDRVAAVKAVLQDVPVEGRIVFTRRAVFPKGMPRFAAGMDTFLSEFPLGDRSGAERAAAPFMAGWQRLRNALRPSPMVKA